MGLEDQYEEANGLPQPKRRESEERIPPVSSLPRSRTAAPSDNGSPGARDLWLRSHQAPNTTRPESRRIYPHGRVWPHAVHSAREALIRVSRTRGRRAPATVGYRPPTVDCPPARFSTTLTCPIRALHKAIARTQAGFNGCPPQSSPTARRAGGGRRGMLQMHYYVIRFRLSSINLWGSHSSCYICSRHQLRLFFLLANALTRSFGLYVLDLSLPLLRSAIAHLPPFFFIYSVYALTPLSVALEHSFPSSLTNSHTPSMVSLLYALSCTLQLFSILIHLYWGLPRRLLLLFHEFYCILHYSSLYISRLEPISITYLARKTSTNANC